MVFCTLSLSLSWFPTSTIYVAWYLDSWVAAFAPFWVQRAGEAVWFWSGRQDKASPLPSSLSPCAAPVLAVLRTWLAVFKWSESLNVRWIPRPQTVWTSNSEKIGAEWFRTQSRKLSFPAGRMELTVILRLQKEHCPGVISLLSGNVDI